MDETTNHAAVVLDARPGAVAPTPGTSHVDLDRDLALRGDPALGGRHPLPPLARWCSQLGAWGIAPHTAVEVFDAEGGANAAARVWWMLRAVGHRHVTLVEGAVPNPARAPLTVVPREPYPCDAWRMPTADADEVERARTDPTWRVIDVRSAARFAGEVEPIDPVAGHIPGARNLFFGRQLDASLRFLPDATVRALYAEVLGGVPPERCIVHCGSGVTACHVIYGMDRVGMGGAKLYVGSWSEWCRGDRPRATGAL